MPVFPASFVASPALALHPDFSPVEMVSAYQAYGPHFAFSPFFLSPFSWDSLQELVAQAYAWHGWESAFLRADISTGFWHPLLADLIGLLRQSFADILGDLPLMALELKREFLNPIEKPAPRFLNGQIAVQLECLLRPQEAEWVMFDQVAPDFASEAIYAKFCQDKTAQNAWMRTQVKRYYALPCQAGSLLLHEATQAHALRPLQAHVQQRCGLSLVFGQRSSVHAVHA